VRSLRAAGRLLTGREVHLVGTSVSRILLGASGVHLYLTSYGFRGYLWGPEGYRAHTGLKSSVLSLYRLSETTAWFEVVFHAGLVVALAFAIFGGRPLAFVHGVFLWSIYQRNPSFLEGGDNFARIAIILLAFTISNAYFAPGAAARRQRLRTRPPGSWSATAHNTAVVLLVFQISLVYLTAGLWKVASLDWRSGTALWSISQLEDWAFAPVLTSLYRSAVVVGVLTYAVVALEVGFVPLLLTRLRIPVVLATAAMHVGIAATMGLVGFAISMCAGLAVCLGDDDYRSLRSVARGGIEAIRRRRAPRPGAAPARTL
jgi:hypothetical protein